MLLLSHALELSPSHSSRVKHNNGSMISGHIMNPAAHHSWAHLHTLHMPACLPSGPEGLHGPRHHCAKKRKPPATSCL